MPNYEIDFQLRNNTREIMRKNLISMFLNEDPGNGKGALATRYTYTVETYNNYKIYLRRPTQLNKGFDFTVNIAGMYFKKQKKYSNPSHEDIFNALSECKCNYPSEYRKIDHAIHCIYNCMDFDMSDISAYFTDYNGANHPIQIILLAIKWLFMEQDCAYWNYSGRAMLFNALIEKGLILDI